MLGVSDILDDTSDIELDRSTTPTPAPNGQPAQSGQPKLRRRRSSLTLGTSPMNVIKSPSRSVGSALQLQRHLYASPGRARSGSTSSIISIGEEVHQTSNNIASESTSLFGRMRSGSIGSALKSRRTIRRVPGPSCPPPSAPLPPLPPLSALPTLPSIPGTPNRSKTKAFSIQVPPSATQSLARKLAAAGGDNNGLALQTNNMFVPTSPTLSSPRQPLGDLQLHYVNDQDVSMRD